MMIFKNMSIAVSTSIICASLFFGNVNAIPVPIVNGNGKQVGMLQDTIAIPKNNVKGDKQVYYLDEGVMKPASELTNNDDLYFLKGCYVKIKNNAHDALEVFNYDGKLLHCYNNIEYDDDLDCNKRYYFDAETKSFEETNRALENVELYYFLPTYVQVDRFDNASVRARNAKGVQTKNDFIAAKMAIYKLCAQLHIEDWNDDIYKFRIEDLFANSKAVINEAF